MSERDGYEHGVPCFVSREQPVPRDVVATMLSPAEDGGAPPHWSVDFWVANVDTGLRRAVVTDPQGARGGLTDAARYSVEAGAPESTGEGLNPLTIR